MSDQPNLPEKEPVFQSIYGVNFIEYRFKFWDTDEKEMHKQIIHLLKERLPSLKLHREGA